MARKKKNLGLMKLRKPEMRAAAIAAQRYLERHGHKPPTLKATTLKKSLRQTGSWHKKKNRQAGRRTVIGR